jgi:hypothetical protein
MSAQIDACGQVSNIITQSTVVRLVGENTTTLEGALNATLADLGLNTPSSGVLHTVTMADTAYHAFGLMREHVRLVQLCACCACDVILGWALCLFGHSESAHCPSCSLTRAVLLASSVVRTSVWR